MGFGVLEHNRLVGCYNSLVNLVKTNSHPYDAAVLTEIENVLNDVQPKDDTERAQYEIIRVMYRSSQRNFMNMLNKDPNRLIKSLVLWTNVDNIARYFDWIGKIYINWDQNTRLCKVVHFGNKRSASDQTDTQDDRQSDGRQVDGRQVDGRQVDGTVWEAPEKKTKWGDTDQANEALTTETKQTSFTGKKHDKPKYIEGKMKRANKSKFGVDASKNKFQQFEALRQSGQTHQPTRQANNKPDYNKPKYNKQDSQNKQGSRQNNRPTYRKVLQEGLTTTGTNQTCIGTVALTHSDTPRQSTPRQSTPRPVTQPSTQQDSATSDSPAQTSPVQDNATQE